MRVQNWGFHFGIFPGLGKGGSQGFTASARGLGLPNVALTDDDRNPASPNIRIPGPPKEPKIMAQYPKMDSKDSIGSIVCAILELQVYVQYQGFYH